MDEIATHIGKVGKTVSREISTQIEVRKEYIMKGMREVLGEEKRKERTSGERHKEQQLMNVVANVHTTTAVPGLGGKSYMNPYVLTGRPGS